MSTEKDYVLGTHDEEIVRLGLQHRLWRPRVLAACGRAGFGAGQTIIDIGCGPGWASLDLAEIVGPTGRVIAVDRSRRYLDALEATRQSRGLDQIETHELDLDEAELPVTQADGAWSRWVFAFVSEPRRLLERAGRALRPGGALVLNEYFDYSTWRVSPRSDDFEAFVAAVIDTWRKSGGEPDTGLDLPRWLADAGFELLSMHPVVDVIRKSDPLWEWPRSFVDIGLQRLIDLGALTPERARAMAAAFAATEATPEALMVTPAVLEIIATRR